MKTHPVTITATRCYLGQIIVQVPDFCRDERLCGIIRSGGSTSRLLANRIRFAPIAGTGLATCFVHTAKELTEAHLSLADIAHSLRADGLSF